MQVLYKKKQANCCFFLQLTCFLGFNLLDIIFLACAQATFNLCRLAFSILLFA